MVLNEKRMQHTFRFIASFANCLVCLFTSIRGYFFSPISFALILVRVYFQCIANISCCVRNGKMVVQTIKIFALKYRFVSVSFMFRFFFLFIVAFWFWLRVHSHSHKSFKHQWCYSTAPYSCFLFLSLWIESWFYYMYKYVFLSFSRQFWFSSCLPVFIRYLTTNPVIECLNPYKNILKAQSEGWIPFKASTVMQFPIWLSQHKLSYA